MALSPRWGVELWQATPRVRTFQRTAPLWQLTRSSRVGSATIARSARGGPAASRDEPVWVNSSSTVQAMTTEAEPGGRSRTSRAKASSIAAIPPLMSQAPRP